MSKIAIVGASGAIGQSIAAALRETGQRYRVIGRNVAKLTNTFGSDPLAEIVAWDPNAVDSVTAAVNDIETMIYLVGVDYTRFDLHPVLMHNALAGAIAAGVKKVILIGTVYPYGAPESNPVNESHIRRPHTFKGQMRKAQEDLLMQAHADGKIQATVLRLPDFYGPDVTASLLHGAIQAAVSGGKADMLGPIDRPHQFVFVPDVGPVIAKLVDTPDAFGNIWHFAGSGVITQREVVTEIARQTGRPLKVRIAGKTMLRLLGIFKPFLREMIEMHYLLTNPIIMDDIALQQLIGPIRRTSYPNGIRQALHAASAHHAAR